MMPYPADFYQYCNRLQSLHLRENELSAVPISISYASSLESLDLSQNFLTSESLDALAGLVNLRNLNLRCNHFVSIPAKILASLPNLRRLDLSNNSIVKIDDSIAALLKANKLVWLNLSYNRITSINSEIGKLSNLVHLNLAYNQITGLPKSLKDLSQLEFLDLQSNFLVDLSPLDGLAQLQTLLASHNQISNFPSNMKLESLMRCSLSHNPLSSFFIKTEIPHLSDLDLSHCKISVVPSGTLGCLSALQRLILDYNNLTALPESVCDLSGLQYLSVAHNQLVCFPQNIHMLRNLLHLDFHRNRIKTIPQVIWKCRKLKLLNVSSNSIRQFPDSPSNFRLSVNSKPAIIASNQQPRKTSTTSLLTSSTSSGSALKTSSRVGVSVRNPADRRSVRKHSASGQVPLPSIAASDPDRKSSDESSSSHHQRDNSQSENNQYGDEIMPLTWSLQSLFLANNDLSAGSGEDENWSLNSISLLTALRVLNLSFCNLRELGYMLLSELQGLEELYLSGNHLNSLPENISELKQLKYLYIDCNKFSSLPGEIASLSRLQTLDGSWNNLRYNVSNFPYDWNWSQNTSLGFLNLSGNHKLEIGNTSSTQAEIESLSFKHLDRLRVLDLSDVKIEDSLIPGDNSDCRIRANTHSSNAMVHGIAEAYMNDSFLTWDMAVSNFMGFTDEHLWGLFVDTPNGLDGGINSQAGGGGGGGSSIIHPSKFLCDNFSHFFMNEMKRNRSSGNVRSCLARTFLALQREYAIVIGRSGGSQGDTFFSAVGNVIYRAQDKIYLANVGDTQAVISRSGVAKVVSRRHMASDRDEVEEVREMDGFFDENGLMMGESRVTRCFGNYNLLPHVKTSPDICEEAVQPEDEFIIVGSPYFWQHITFQHAVDIAQSSDSHTRAAQKLRDIVLAYGAKESFCVMVVPIKNWFMSRLLQIGVNHNKVCSRTKYFLKSFY